MTTPMTLCLLTATLTLAACVPTSPPAETPVAGAPIFGTWDCGVMGFSLTPTRYSLAPTTPVTAIERLDAANHRVTLGDGYRFVLSNPTGSTLTWTSLETGDSFDCRRSR